MSIHASARRDTFPPVSGIPWAELAGVRVGIVLWGGLAVLDLARIAAVSSYAAGAVMVLLVTAASVGAATRAGLGAAGTGWLLIDGFVEHRAGVLGWDGRHDLALLVGMTALALLATRARR
ncbi:MAG TPA: hypothetical protein VHW64_05825 [Nocardioides sp.]|uniref:hypothetical protein n=1 Tax=Nocardioides sp. TaxID=35761 RepID=UPI002E347B68|nr:hypothetical protein [Nocardioides sp.]HEX3930201.1 hypothetical protein [Nocardioides sp.]